MEKFRYFVVQENSVLDLLKIVENFLNKGWSCQGGVFVSQSAIDPCCQHYLQAVIKKEGE